MHIAIGGIANTTAALRSTPPRYANYAVHAVCTNYRRRTKLVYTLYSRKPDVDVWTNLRQLGVNYAVLESYWCRQQQRYNY